MWYVVYIGLMLREPVMCTHILYKCRYASHPQCSTNPWWHLSRRLSPPGIFAGWLRPLAIFDRPSQCLFLRKKKLQRATCFFSDSMVLCAHAARSIIMVLGASDTEQMSRAAADAKNMQQTLKHVEITSVEMCRSGKMPYDMHTPKSIYVYFWACVLYAMSFMWSTHTLSGIYNAETVIG